jgi:hypothetical protein
VGTAGGAAGGPVHPFLRFGPLQQAFQGVAVVGLCALCHVIPVLGRVRHLDGKLVMLFREETSDAAAADLVGGDDPDTGAVLIAYLSQ